jgi:hypothetical protein
VYCKIEECLRSLSVENNAVLFVLKNILVSLTEELDSISMLLLQTDCYFSFSAMILLRERRSESAGRIGLGLRGGVYYFLANI